MSALFLSAVNRAVAAGWLILAVLLLRPVLHRAPKWVRVALWGIVALRLVCPFSVESVLSLIPSAETVSPQIMTERVPTIESGVPALNAAVNPIIGEVFAPDPLVSANPLQLWVPTLGALWLLGAAAMLLYAAVSWLRLHRRMRTAVRLTDNIYESEQVGSCSGWRGRASICRSVWRPKRRCM